MAFLTFLRRNAPFLAVGVLLTFCSSFGQTFFISVFAGSIRADFGLTNGDWGLLYSIGTTASAAVMIWTGILTDRFRVRILGPVTLALLALACLSMWAAQGWWSLAFTIFAKPRRPASLRAPGRFRTLRAPVSRDQSVRIRTRISSPTDGSLASTRR